MSFFDRNKPAATNDDVDRERWVKLSEVVKLGLDHFRKTGRAMKEIRDRELYRFEFATFADCCRAKWNITDRHAGRLIDAATFAEELAPGVPVPESERQFRPLQALPEEERAEAWIEAQANGGTPAAVATAVAKRKPRKSKTGALKPLRLKVPGGVVVVTPNRKGKDYAELLTFALRMIDEKKQAA